MATIASSCSMSSWMISHLGKKPVSGGRPASDSSVSMRVVLSMGVLVQEVISVGRFAVSVVLIERKMEAVIRV